MKIRINKDGYIVSTAISSKNLPLVYCGTDAWIGDESMFFKQKRKAYGRQYTNLVLGQPHPTLQISKNKFPSTYIVWYEKE